MPVASSIEADAADGNLDKWKGRIIIVDYTRCDTEKSKNIFPYMGGFYMKQISMDFNKRQYMRPVDFELFYYAEAQS